MRQNEANELPKRKTMRLKGADYSATGAYFITICTHEKACIFGHIHDEEMCLNELGRVVNAVWNEIPLHYPQVQTDAWVVMPNHVHGIVFFQSPSSQSVEIVPHPCRPAPVDPYGESWVALRPWMRRKYSLSMKSSLGLMTSRSMLA